MRITFALLISVSALFLAACQSAPPPSTTRPGVAQPPGPMDTLTNPMNQQRTDRNGALR